MFPPTLAGALRTGYIAVIPTDTLYGIVCSARLPLAVEKLYRVRGRNPEKPCILLIDSADVLGEFGIVPNAQERLALEKVWPGKVSVVFDCPGEQFRYLHRGTQSIAFRVPAHSDLLKLLSETGPLLAPSANPEGMPPAIEVQDANAYFGSLVDSYVDGGKLAGEPSTVARLENGKWQVLRLGAVSL